MNTCPGTVSSGGKAHHLDFGSELRDISSCSDSSHFYNASEIAFIKAVLEDQHFPLARKIICSFLGRSGFSSNDAQILNGIPRHTGQTKDISSVASIRTLLLLECLVGSVLYRLRDDNVGGDRKGRFDEDVSLVDKKFGYLMSVQRFLLIITEIRVAQRSSRS